MSNYHSTLQIIDIHQIIQSYMLEVSPGSVGVSWRSVCSHFRVSLESIWNLSGVEIGVGLSSVWDRFGVGLWSVWGRFGIGLGSVWHHFGVTYKHFPCISL